MSQRAQELSRRIEAFRDEVIALVEKMSDDDWSKTTEWEKWPVAAAVRHLGAGHFAIAEIAGMIARGEALPRLSMDQINAMSEKDVQAHLDCTRAEAIELIQKNCDAIVAFVSGLSHDELDRTGSMPAFGGEASTGQFIDLVLLQSGSRHFDSIKKAVGAD